jgi:nucleoporin SEH1
VWQVEWNATGTVLSSCGDDGVIRMWKCLILLILGSYLKEWKQIGEIIADK